MKRTIVTLTATFMIATLAASPATSAAQSTLHRILEAGEIQGRHHRRLEPDDDPGPGHQHLPGV